MPSITEPFLIVGLGNPGPKYAKHRHNVGFMAIDEAAAYFNCAGYTTKATAQYTEARIAGSRVYFLKPMAYMNRSGQSVRHFMDYYTIPSDNVLVFHDELDLEFSRIKLKRGGGHAGHNGLKDIAAHCGPDFWRFRFGIGHPGNREDVSNYVLSDFSKHEIRTVGECLDQAVQALPLWIENNIDGFNQAVTKES